MSLNYLRMGMLERADCAASGAKKGDGAGAGVGIRPDSLGRTGSSCGSCESLRPVAATYIM